MNIAPGEVLPEAVHQCFDVVTFDVAYVISIKILERGLEFLSSHCQGRRPFVLLMDIFKGPPWHFNIHTDFEAAETTDIWSPEVVSASIGGCCAWASPLGPEESAVSDFAFFAPELSVNADCGEPSRVRLRPSCSLGIRLHCSATTIASSKTQPYLCCSNS
jgi:hypothetical protein